MLSLKAVLERDLPPPPPFGDMPLMMQVWKYENCQFNRELARARLVMQTLMQFAGLQSNGK